MTREKSISKFTTQMCVDPMKLFYFDRYSHCRTYLQTNVTEEEKKENGKESTFSFPSFFGPVTVGVGHANWLS